jgi:gluconate kinase
MVTAYMEKGEPMTNEDCAKWLVELHSDYFQLSDKYRHPVVIEYAEAVAKAIMAMAERRTDDERTG